MEASEATPFLKPPKHRWYTACCLVMVFIWCASGIEHTLRACAPADGIEVGEFIMGTLGYIIGSSLHLVPMVAFLLLLLFFFDGRLVKAVVGLGLVALALLHAVHLSLAVRVHLDATAAAGSTSGGCRADDGGGPAATTGAEIRRPSATPQAFPARRRQRGG